MMDLKGAGSDIVMSDALRWIEVNQDKPFAALIHFREPHLPYTPMPDEDTTLFKSLEPTIPDVKGLDREQVKQLYRDYYAAVHAVDRNLGKLLALLERLKLENRTIVIFQSDHGYNIGQHGIHTKGNGYVIAGGVVDQKASKHVDTSLRIPLLIRCPGTFKPGTEVNETILNLDMFPSVLGLLGDRSASGPASQRPRFYAARSRIAAITIGGLKSLGSTIFTIVVWLTCACFAPTSGSWCATTTQMILMNSMISRMILAS
jgi:uncharacterized sulfatase